MSTRSINERRSQGFTLVELMVGIALGAIASAVLFSVFVGSQEMYYDTRNMVSGESDSRVVVSMISHEIRAAGNDLGEAGIERIATAAPDTLRLLSDLNGDGVIGFTEPPEDVTYFYDGMTKSLVRNSGAGNVQLLQALEALNFSYMDAAGNPIGPGVLDAAERAQVRAVRLTMQFRDAQGNLEDINTMVSIRNR